jgi:hypothetical protein
MTGDLELPEAGDLELGPALAAHEVDVEPVDVLRLGRGWTVLEGTGCRARERSKVSDPEPPNEVGERDGGEEGEPPGHRSTVAADRDRLAWRSRSRRFVSTYRR